MNCPKCGYQILAENAECPKCGIVYEKYQAIVKEDYLKNKYPKMRRQPAAERCPKINIKKPHKFFLKSAQPLSTKCWHIKLSSLWVLTGEVWPYQDV